MIFINLFNGKQNENIGLKSEVILFELSIKIRAELSMKYQVTNLATNLLSMLVSKLKLNSKSKFER